MVLSGGSVKADFTFGEATNLGPVINTTSNEWAVCLSPDGLEMYFISDRPGGSGDFDIWLTTRVAIDADWDPPENLGPMINSPGTEFSAGISSDGLTLYFNSDRAGSDGLDLWKSTRVHKNDLWTIPINLGPIVNSQYWESTATISADGLELYFLSDRPGGLGGSYGDIWLTTRTSLEEPWAEPVNPSILNSAHNEGLTCLSADGLTLFFDTDRPGGTGDWDIWFSRRRTLQDAWSKPTNLGSMINTTYFEGMGPLAPDGRTLYFGSTRPGGLGGDWGDIWQVPIIPVVDLNEDGIVDSDDMVIMVDNWGTDNSLCDIGPMSWGDGVVDVEDLIVLAEHLFEEVLPVE
jgi:Tol biopolymer transport system component